mgnify:FL=1
MGLAGVATSDGSLRRDMTTRRRGSGDAVAEHRGGSHGQPGEAPEDVVANAARSRASPVALFKQLHAQFHKVDSTETSLRECCTAYDLVLFKHTSPIPQLLASPSSPSTWTAASKQGQASPTPDEPGMHLRDRVLLRLQLSSCLILERVGMDASANRLRTLVTKLRKFEPAAGAADGASGSGSGTGTALASAPPSPSSSPSRSPAPSQRGVEAALLLLFYLRRPEAMTRKPLKDFALLGHTASATRKLAPTADPQRVHTFQARSSEPTRSLFLNTVPRAVGAVPASGLLNDCDPLKRRHTRASPAGSTRRPAPPRNQGFAQVASNVFGTHAAPARKKHTTDLFGSLHRTALILPAETSLPRSLLFRTPALPSAPAASTTTTRPEASAAHGHASAPADAQRDDEDPQTTQHTSPDDDLRSTGVDKGRDGGGVKAPAAPVSLLMLDRVNAPKAYLDHSGGVNSVAASADVPSVLWHQSVIDGESDYQGREPTRQRKTQHVEGVPTAPKRSSPSSRVLGWDAASTTAERDRPSASAFPPQDLAERGARTSRLPVSEMDLAGVRWWQRRHFLHIFSKHAAQIQDEVLCGSAIHCLLGIPSDLFVLGESRHPDSCKEFRLPPSLARVDLCTMRHSAAVVRRLVHVVTAFGSTFRRLTAFVEFFSDLSNSQSLILSAFSDRIGQTLSGYHKAIVRFSEGPGAQDVLQLLAFASDAQIAAHVLAKLCFGASTTPGALQVAHCVDVGTRIGLTTFSNGMRFFRGPELLSHIYSIARQSSIGSFDCGVVPDQVAVAHDRFVDSGYRGEDVMSRLVRDLFQVCAAPYLNALELFIYKGGVRTEDDPYREFAFAHSPDDQEALQGSNHIHIPIFFSNNDINEVSRLGQLMQILQMERNQPHATMCVLDTLKLRRQQPGILSRFGLSLEFRARESLANLTAAEKLWKSRDAELSTAIEHARIQAEHHAREELRSLVDGLRARRREFEAYTRHLEELELKEVAEGELAKRLLLEELKVNASKARAKRHLRKMQTLEQELQALEQRKSLPRYVAAQHVPIQFDGFALILSLSCMRAVKWWSAVLIYLSSAKICGRRHVPCCSPSSATMESGPNKMCWTLL